MQNESPRLIAQFNISKLRHGLEDPRLVGFGAGASMIRKAASLAPGHVWNEQDVIDDSFFATRSIWESHESLHAFVYSGIHQRYLDRSEEWFVRTGSVNMVLWWIGRDEIPTLDESRSRLELLRGRGPSKQAFDFCSAPRFTYSGG